MVGDETYTLARGDIAPDAIVEIGSIGKTLTATLLSVMMQAGEVALDDPVNRLLPERAHLPAREGDSITLLDLATHSSGLPRLPPKFLERVVDERNPYAHYTVEQLYEDLPQVELVLSSERIASYSNLGFGLLGHVLGVAARTPYERLVVERVCAPLGMTETSVGAPVDLSRRAQGHDEAGAPTPHWDDATLAGAGAHEATLQDMLTYLRANLRPDGTALGSAIRATHEPRARAGERMHVGLAWHILHTRSERRLIWHNGGTGGFRSMACFDLAAGTGVVALCNCSDHHEMDGAALRALETLSAA